MRSRILIQFLTLSFLFGQTVQLNEIVSSNGASLYDEDGDTPDWIELFNSTEQSIDLLGFGITDDPGDLSKWTFPSFHLEPNSFIVLFASDKDRKGIVAQWDAKIDWGDPWSYWVGSSSPISDWELPGTDVSFWPTGNSGFGYGDNDDNTEISQVVSVFVKKDFEVDDPSIILKALFHIDYDDGYIAYLNGIEFSRANLGSAGSDVYYNTTTTALHEAEIYSGGFPEEISIDLNEFPILSGTNTLAVQVHNYSNNSSDLSCIPFLTLGYEIEIEDTIEPNELIELPTSFLHTNFKISSNGESIILSDPSEIILDSIATDNIETDMSFGRILETEVWALFDEPTPEASNSTPTFTGALEMPEFSIVSGFYDQSQLSLELSVPNESAAIYFTLDGSVPSTNGLPYEYPIVINSNTVVRARAFLDQWVPSEIGSKTYILDDELGEMGLPAIFISTDHNSFFDEDTGMYVMGPNAEWQFPYFGANFWEDWERPIHFEILEVDGSGYNANAGAKIFGGWSRAFPQKSLSIFSRSYLGPSSFDYQLFPNSDVSSYEAFVIRNSGNDWESTVLRDGFTTSLANDLDIDFQKYRPTILFINGEFWGIQNLREKVNEHFLSSKHSIAPEHIDLLDLAGVNDENIVHGTNSDYKILLDYLEGQDMTEPVVQNALENWIDIESYMSYQAFQIFVDNRDWPGNNIKFWRDHRVGGKWRWILYDTDFGFSIWDANAYNFNTLGFALEPNGPGWPNPPWSTFIFRKMMENNYFKESFINIYCDMLNTVFQPEFISERLDSISGNIASMIPTHRDRWYNSGNWPNSGVNWESRLNNMENFGNQRRIRAIGHLIDEFDLPNIAQVDLSVTPPFGGYIKLNTLDIEESNWQGYYFPSIPIEVKAIQYDGFEFSHWLQFPDSSNSMRIDITDPFYLTAVFIQSELSPGSIVINEINYNSNDDHESGDWIELYNPGQMEIDISNWVMKDDNDQHSFTMPDETVINGGSYAVIVRDVDLFYDNYSNDIPVIGPFDFGLGGGGDQVRIYNDLGALMDSVNYDDVEPWPIEADGQGPTLELINPSSDNSLPESWVSSQQFGSPAEQNTNFLDSDDQVHVLLPEQSALLPAYPNPFNGSVKIPFKLSSQTNSSITIYNVLGKRILDIPIENMGPGDHYVSWNGLNQMGRQVGNGVYFLRLNIDLKSGFQKLVYLK